MPLIKAKHTVKLANYSVHTSAQKRKKFYFVCLFVGPKVNLWFSTRIISFHFQLAYFFPPISLVHTSELCENRVFVKVLFRGYTFRFV